MTDGHCSATTSLRPMNSTAKYLHPGTPPYTSWRSAYGVLQNTQYLLGLSFQPLYNGFFFLSLGFGNAQVE